MRRTHASPRITALLAAATGLVLAASACSSEGGKKADEGGDVDTPEMTIAMITHQVPGDTF